MESYLLYGLVVIAVVIGARRVWRRSMRPLPNYFTAAGALHGYIKFFLQNGLDGATLQIHTVSASHERVTLRKYFNGSALGFEALIDKAAVREEILAEIAAVASTGQGSAEIGKSEGTEHVFDCGAEVSKGERIVEVLFSHGFGREMASDCVAYFTRVLGVNVPRLTGFPASGESNMRI
jgi:hypothetical protein